MKTRVTFTIFVSLLLLAPALWPQTGQLRRALVIPKSGNGMSGYLVEIRVGIEDDTLVLMSGGQTQKFLMGDLARVVVLAQNEEGNGFLHGALIGTYLTTYLLGQVDRYNRQPAAFLEETYSSGAGLLLSAFLGIGIGGGVGYMVKSSEGETSFNFTGSEIERKTARRKFYERLSGESSSPKFHLSVQGGHVSTQGSKGFQEAMGSNSYNYYGSGASEFNWLRKLQLTYSVEPDIEIGGAVQWSGEPAVSASRYENSGPNTSLSRNATQSLSVVGYYGVCKYQPFYGTVPKQIGFVVGGGIGIVNIEYSHSVNTSTYTSIPPYNSTNSYVQDNVEDMTASAIMFGEFNLYLRESLSLGLTADFVYYPPKKVAAIANLPEQTFFGNACIGFVLGLHL